MDVHKNKNTNYKVLFGKNFLVCKTLYLWYKCEKIYFQKINEFTIQMDLNYKVFGQGEPLVILHGLFGTLDNWQTVAKKLAEHFTVYIIDQRNHGRSPHHVDFNYSIMAEDLRVFMENQWIYNAHILGHSMGGKTAMTFALNNEDMVNKLIIVDIGTKKYEGGHQQIFDALFSMDLAALKSRKEANAQLEELIPDIGVRQFLLKNLTRTKMGNYEWKMNLPVIHENYEQILLAIDGEKTFEKDMLFIRGGLSDYIVDEDLSNIQKKFPKARLHTVEQSGHWVHAEAPDQLLAIVQEFLLIEK